MKERHIKTFPEKYGTNDVREEADEFIRTNRNKMSGDEIFNKLPYLGYFRIDTENRDLSWWWHETEEDWIVAKVLYVDEDFVYYSYFDTHHYTLSYAVEKYFGFVLRGNVLEKVSD